MSGLTPSQTVGPFYAYGLTPNGQYDWVDTFTNNLLTPDVSGDRIRIAGQVFDGDGATVRDAVLEIWQADAQGRFADPQDKRALPNSAFKGFGRSGTDAEGRFAFETIKPGIVPDPDGKPQAPHIVLAVYARGLLLHVLQGAGPARVDVLGVVEEGLQVAGDHRQRRAQLVGDVGDEVLAHLFQTLHAGHVADQHQVLAVAVEGDLELQQQLVVHRRGHVQRLLVVAAGEVFLEARVADQVGHRLAAVLRALQAEQAFGGEVPPLQVAIGVEHDHRIAQRRGGFLHAVDHRLQAPAGALVAPLQVVDAVEHLAPQAVAVRRRFVLAVVLQPFVQAQHLPEGPAEVDAQAACQGPTVLPAHRADQRGGDYQQQQMADQGATPVLVHQVLSL